MQELRSLALARWRVAIALSAVVVVLYFGFIVAVAFFKEFMGTQIVPGLSVGMVVGAGVIIGAWLTTWIYVSWANRHFDGRLSALKAKQRP